MRREKKDPPGLLPRAPRTLVTLLVVALGGFEKRIARDCRPRLGDDSRLWRRLRTSHSFRAIKQKVLFRTLCGEISYEKRTAEDGKLKLGVLERYWMGLHNYFFRKSYFRYEIFIFLGHRFCKLGVHRRPSMSSPLRVQGQIYIRPKNYPDRIRSRQRKKIFSAPNRPFRRLLP